MTDDELRGVMPGDGTLEEAIALCRARVLALLDKQARTDPIDIARAARIAQQDTTPTHEERAL